MTPSPTIDRLIVNSPYDEPRRHWRYHRESRAFSLEDGRRSAGYLVASERSKAFDDPGQFVEIPLVNQIRPRVATWRAAGYPGASGITKRLLAHWQDPERFADRRFFFCQLEAIETLIWLTEAPAAEHVGIDVPSDGGPFPRLASKMATGTGKTIVMAMAIAWQVLNKVAYPQDTRFGKHFLVIAPGLTVRNRLAVLDLTAPGNYYTAFDIVPSALADQLRQGKVLVRNWHALAWETDERVARRRSVDKRGPKSNEAYAREVLGDLASAKNLVVINDEAHHAWRVPAGAVGPAAGSGAAGALESIATAGTGALGSRVARVAGALGVSKEELDEATKWVGGLDRIHAARGVQACFDFSATPFVPSGKHSTGEALFGWIVSDFGLNDAIESGLVKTPRVVVRDDAVPDATSYKSRLYHLYNDPEVKDDLNRKAAESEPLPDLVANAYYLLGYDWRETLQRWQASGAATPPVMITVANRTETAARVKFAFDHERIRIHELCDPERTLHIDSRVLELAEAEEGSAEGGTERETPSPAESEDGADAEGDGPVSGPARRPLTKREQADFLRRQVDTVGQAGRPGEAIHNVISVGMLSEGWDAKTVTHIMGLRAFSSQLLCEQVVGRGLRRTSYEVKGEDGLFEPEYVNIFGVPFTFLPHEGGDGPAPAPTAVKTMIRPLPERGAFAIRWPNVIRIERVYRSRLEVDWDGVQTLLLDATDTPRVAELAPVVEGKPDVTKITAIDLEHLAGDLRWQRLIFETAADVYHQVKPDWRGGEAALLAQLVRLVEEFLATDKLAVRPAAFGEDDAKRRLILMLNMTKVVQHLWQAVRVANSEALALVLDTDAPVRSTGDMGTWYSGKPCEFTKKSHINYAVFDSAWEASEAYQLDASPLVEAWAKNDHLGFEIRYVYRGIVRNYRPDFLIRLVGGRNLVLETKGADTEQDVVKRQFLDEWVRAVNADGGFGAWAWDVSFAPADVGDILAKWSAA